MDNINNANHKDFEPAIFNSWDFPQLQSKQLNRFLLRPYTRLAQRVVRNKVDVVMFTHLLLYFSTSVPSALFLFFGRFSWLHGLLHFVMQMSYTGTYTLMMHQHIHANGILQKTLPWSLFDYLFPYITDPLMGHTWNSYYFHHVKHHHVEGNGPDDLSSTIRYQRDSVLHFLHYFGRFLLFAWLELPLYFFRKGRPFMGAKTMFWDVGNYVTLYLLFQVNPRATTCVFLLPLALMRLGLMAGNWGQHAFVDNEEPDSDYRSSITVIDVQVSFSPDTGSPLAMYANCPSHPAPEQQTLLQRWLSHIASSQPAASLEGTPQLLPEDQGHLCVPGRHCSSQH